MHPAEIRKVRLKNKMELSLRSYGRVLTSITMCKCSRNRELLLVQSEYNTQQHMHTYTRVVNLFPIAGHWCSNDVAVVYWIWVFPLWINYPVFIQKILAARSEILTRVFICVFFKLFCLLACFQPEGSITVNFTTEYSTDSTIPQINVKRKTETFVLCAFIIES